MIGLQDLLKVWAVPWVVHVCHQQSAPSKTIISKAIKQLILLTKWFFQVNIFGNPSKCHCSLNKRSLHLQTACWSQASNFSPTLQLHFSWTLELSNRRNNLFTRPSDNVSNFLSTMCNQQRNLSKPKLFEMDQFTN